MSGSKSYDLVVIGSGTAAQARSTGEEAARAEGLRFHVKSQKVPDWFTARRCAETVYGFKTLVEEDTGRILGAHLVGPHADEVINLFGLALRHDLTADDLKQTIFA